MVRTPFQDTLQHLVLSKVHEVLAVNILAVLLIGYQSGFELVTQNRFAKNSERNKEKVLLQVKKFLGLQIIAKILN